jgi:type IV pilus assembly protein PilC
MKVDSLSLSEEKLLSCIAVTEKGESFSRAVTEVGLFAPVYCRMLSIGEKSGSVDVIMQEIARRTQEDMDAAFDRLTGRIEPGTVIILSLCVGLLLISVMLPLVGIMSAL